MTMYQDFIHSFSAESPDGEERDIARHYILADLVRCLKNGLTDNQEGGKRYRNFKVGEIEYFTQEDVFRGSEIHFHREILRINFEPIGAPEE